MINIMKITLQHYFLNWMQQTPRVFYEPGTVPDTECTKIRSLKTSGEINT